MEDDKKIEENENNIKNTNYKKEKDYFSTSLIILSIIVLGVIIVFSIFRFMWLILGG